MITHRKPFSPSGTHPKTDCVLYTSVTSIPDFMVHLKKQKPLDPCCSHEADKMCFTSFSYSCSTCPELTDWIKQACLNGIQRGLHVPMVERGLPLKRTVKLQQLVCQGGRFASRRGSVTTQWEPERCRALLQLRAGPHRSYSLLLEAFESQHFTLQPPQKLTTPNIMRTAEIHPDSWLKRGADMMWHSAWIIRSGTKVGTFRPWQITPRTNQNESQFLHTLKRYNICFKRTEVNKLTRRTDDGFRRQSPPLEPNRVLVMLRGD